MEAGVGEVAAWAAWVVRGCSQRVAASPAPSGSEASGRAELTTPARAHCPRSRAPRKAGRAKALWDASSALGRPAAVRGHAAWASGRPMV